VCLCVWVPSAMAKTFAKWNGRGERDEIEGKMDVGFVRFVGFFNGKRLREVEISLLSMKRRFREHGEEAGEGEKIEVQR